MKVSVLQENLSKALKITGRATASRSTLPVLGNVLIKTQDGSLIIQGTNLEIGITCRVGAKVQQEGATTLPIKLFNDFIANLPPERIDLSLDEEAQTTNIKCHRYESNLKGINADDFPIVAQLDDKYPSFEIQSAILYEMIDAVVIAAATDESRPILTGVLVQIEDGLLRMVTADGFRLSLKEMMLSSEGDKPNDFSVIVPVRAMDELRKAIGKDTDDLVTVQLSQDNKQILFRVGDIQIVSQLIVGKFPDYRQIIPQKYKEGDGMPHTTSIVDKDAFLKTVKVAQLFARESANIVIVNITSPNGDGSQGKIQLDATSAELGNNESVIDAMVRGEEVQIGVNGGYMIDYLSVLKSSQVMMQATVPSAPILFQPVGDDTFTHVIMPMHINHDRR